VSTKNLLGVVSLAACLSFSSIATAFEPSGGAYSDPKMKRDTNSWFEPSRKYKRAQI
jgi:hypothetical protein